MPVNLKGKSFKSLLDLTPQEIRYLLDLSRDLKAKKRAGIPGQCLRGKNIVLLFEKTSTRTRCAFEVAVHDEGGHVTYLDPAGSQMGKKESLEDTARVLGRFFDGIEYRGYDQEIVKLLALHSGVPVYNGLTDADHPTQILADLLTIEEHCRKPLREVRVVFPGDVRNNMCYAWMYGCAQMGMAFVGIGPRRLIDGVDPQALGNAQKVAEATGAHIELTDDLGAVAGADVVYGDIWASMGEEALIPERTQLLAPYKVTAQLLRRTENNDVLYMHCLPSFHDDQTTLARQWLEKGVNICEVEDEVFRSRHSVVFDEAENRMHTIKAVLVATL